MLLPTREVPLSDDFADNLRTYALVWSRCAGVTYFQCRRRRGCCEQVKLPLGTTPAICVLPDLLLVRPDNALTSLMVRFASLIGLLTELRIQNAEKIEGCTCFLDVFVPLYALLPLTASHL